MVQYTLELHTQDSPPKGYTHSIDLTQPLEDNPEQYFTFEVRQTIQSYLQKESSYAIREHHLNQIIDTWIEDIQEGYRSTRITLDLPLLFETNVVHLQDKGHQDYPLLFPPDLQGIEPIEGMLPSLENIYNP